MSTLEDTIISRDFNNQVHRLNNLDFSNISKSTNASDKHIEMIKKILPTKYYKEETDKFKNYCQLRLENPTASIAELTILFQQRFNAKITRSGINHYIIKLRRYYHKLNK
jgi:DNA-binding protein WhiA